MQDEPDTTIRAPRVVSIEGAYISLSESEEKVVNAILNGLPQDNLEKALSVLGRDFQSRLLAAREADKKPSTGLAAINQERLLLVNMIEKVKTLIELVGDSATPSPTVDTSGAIRTAQEVFFNERVQDISSVADSLRLYDSSAKAAHLLEPEDSIFLHPSVIKLLLAEVLTSLKALAAQFTPDTKANSGA